MSLYKNEKETKLRHQIHLSDLSAIASLKDPKHKRENVFGLFSPSRNYHFEAPSQKDALEWVKLIRKVARIEEEEEEMFLGSPLARSVSPGDLMARNAQRHGTTIDDYTERMLSSSPEAFETPTPRFMAETRRRKTPTIDSSGQSGNEMPSQSDLSDSDMPRGQPFATARPPPAETGSLAGSAPLGARPPPGRAVSQASIYNVGASSSNGTTLEQDLDRVIWQGWLWLLKSKGVKQWKDMWAVLRPRNLILYKDETEYTAQWILQLSAVVDVVDTDPVSRNKENCLQIITEEKTYRFCTHDEESLFQFLGAFKSLLAKRRGMEVARAAASAS